MVAKQRSQTADKGDDPWHASKDHGGRTDPWAKPDNRDTKSVSAMQLAHIEQSVHKKVLDSIKDQVHPKNTDEDEEMAQVTESRVTELEHQIHRMQTAIHAAPGLDSSTATEMRFNELEQKVQTMQDNMQQMSNGMQTFQQQQNAHNNEIVGQITAVKQQVDNQQQGLANLLDQKMEEQMERIDALLIKRAKLE